MAKLCLNKATKRITLKRKFKIEKNVRAHNRKVRKAARKKKGKAKKMIVVPNNCPFKEDILKEVAEAKQRKEEEKQQKRELLKAEKQAKKAGTLESFIEDAEMKENINVNLPRENNQIDQIVSKQSEKPNSTKAYGKEFKKVVETADVVLEVLDARDPIGTRCEQLEETVRSSGRKRLIIILNKADLVPRDVLDKWLKYLRRSFPAIPFKANTQSQARRLGRRQFKKKAPKKALEVSHCVGGELLMSLLANYCRNKEIKTSITVGVVGLPNVGKSSIINSLKRRRSCPVGATPGVTKQMQEIQLDQKIKLLDSPGVILKSGGTTADVLRNATRAEQLKDPISVATVILSRSTKQQMMELYDISSYDTPTEFFAYKAKRNGRYKRGGILDVEGAAKSVIDDWNTGKIRYYTEPPEDETVVHVSSAIVEQEAAEFDLDKADYEKMEINLLNSIQESAPPQPEPLPELLEEMDEDEKSDNKSIVIDNTDILMKRHKKTKSRNRKKKSEKNDEYTMQEITPLTRLKKFHKLVQKKLKKQKNKREREATSLANVLEKWSIAPGKE